MKGAGLRLLTLVGAALLLSGCSELFGRALSEAESDGYDRGWDEGRAYERQKAAEVPNGAGR